jgi:hypothetical protein
MKMVYWFCLFITLIVFGFNGLIMLISPRAWFRMPFWLRFSGSLPELKYVSGWGAITVRLLGICLISLVVYLSYGIVFRK